MLCVIKNIYQVKKLRAGLLRARQNDLASHNLPTGLQFVTCGLSLKCKK